MVTSSHRKVSRKELRQPDEFVTLFDRAGEFLAANLFRVIIGAVITIAIIAAGFGVSFYERHQARVAAEDFYHAMRSLDHKQYKKAERQFSDLADSRGGSNPGRLAQFYLATVYLDENQPAKARDTLTAFLERSNQPLFKQMALTQLGVINEDVGDYRAAHEAYLRAAMIDGPRKQAAELGVARTLARQGRKSEAVAAYRQFLRENPFSQERESVIEALANLGVVPAESSAKAQMIDMRPSGGAPAHPAGQPATLPAPSHPVANSPAQPKPSNRQGGAAPQPK